MNRALAAARANVSLCEPWLDQIEAEGLTPLLRPCSQSVGIWAERFYWQENFPGPIQNTSTRRTSKIAKIDFLRDLRARRVSTP